MKLFAFAAVLASITSPADDNNSISAKPAAENVALEYLSVNSAAGHQFEPDGPAPPGCFWDGTAPFCAGSCPQGTTEEGRGTCGDGACCWTGYKVICCVR